MKHKFLKFLPFDTMSRVFNDCRDSVGRLSTLILLLFALSFGFNQEAKANVYHVVGVAATNSNDYDLYVNSNRQTWGWYSWKMDKAGITFEGKKLYITQHETDNGYLNNFQILLKQGDTQKDYKEFYSGSGSYGYYDNQILNYDDKNAYSKLTMGKSKIYFNATGWNQTTLKLVVGHANYQKYYQMSQITNTKLYYVNPDLSSWSDAMGFGIVGGTSASDGTNWLTDVSAKAQEYTGFLHYGLNNNGDNVMYYVTNAGSTGQKPSCDYHDNYTDLNKTQTIKVMVKKAGASSYTEEKTFANWPATIKAKRYKLNSNGASEADETDANLTSATFTSVITSTAKIYVPTPNTGYTFKGWGTSSSATPSDASSAYEYTVDDTKTIYLFFEENTYSVTAAAGTGCASVSPTGAQTVGQLTGKQFTATASTGYSFESWTSNNGGTFSAQTATTTFNPTGDATITANFTENLTSVTISSNGNGTVSPTEASVGVATTQSVTATPSTGYHFVSWAVTGNADIKDLTTTNPVTLYGNGSAGTGTLTATFAETTYSITVEAGANGSVASNSVSAGQITSVALPTATPTDGYNFKNWTATEGITITNANSADGATITATKAGTVTANFESAATYSITVATDPAAAFTASSGSADNITLGQSYSISATLAEKGYTFTGWTAEPEANASFADKNAQSTTVTVSNGSVTVTANAEAKTTTLTLHGNGGTPESQVITATYDQQCPSFTEPTRTGYSYGGYTSTQDGSTNVINKNGTFPNSGTYGKSGNLWGYTTKSALDIYAKWAATSSNQIELNKNFTAGKRTGEHGKAYITFDATAFDAGFTHATSSVGFTLLGYSTDAEGTNMVVNADGTFKTSVENYTDENGKWINPTFPTKLYAQWEEFMTTVTLSANPEGAGTIRISNTTSTETSVGITSTKAASAYSIDNNAYTFTSWTATNCSVENPTSSTGGQLSGDGTNATGTLVANFSLIPCNLVQLNAAKTSKSAEAKNTFVMQYDNAKKAYYVDVTPDASPFYFYFNYNGHKYSTDWKDKWDGGYTSGLEVTVSLGATPSKADIKDEQIEGWDYLPSIVSKACSSYPVRIWFDYNAKKTWITADAETQWSLAGSDELGGWSTSQNVMTHVSESSVLWNVAVDLQANKEYEFKIVNRAAGEYYGCDYTIKSDYQTTTELSTSESKNVKIQTTEAGSYNFQWSTGTKKVTVTYPAAQTYTVAMAVVGEGTTEPATNVELNAFTGTQISATPADGYHFKNWTGTDGITFADANSATTTAKASQTGTITAHFAANTPIYFQNAIKNTWNPEHLYIYLYKDNTYWEGTGDNKQDRGTGSDKSKYNGSCIAGPLEMTHIQNTDIWEYAYDPALSFTTIVFSDQTMTDYEWFANCTAVRRTDFNSCMNMFVLNDATEEWHNNNTARYFNNGFWRNYNSTTSKMYLHIWDVTATKELNDGAGYEMTTSLAGNETFNAKVNLSGSHQYNIYLGACNNKNFSQNVTITSENCSGIQMYQYNSIDDKSQLAYLHTAASGDYTFSLTFADDKMLLSVEYPITSNDYRVKIGTPARYSNIIRAAEESGTISMFLNAGTNTFTYEEATNVDVSPIEWTAGGTIDVNVEKAGVYTMTLSRDKNITNVEPYTGKYYIRTDCAQGGWNEYKTNDNNLMQFTDRNPKFVNDSTFGFNYYYCRWNANASGNVRFVVANEINACISDTMKADVWLDNGEALKGMANIRFGWNSNTNALSRAYISGSYNEATYLQILSSDSKIYEYAEEVEQQTVITAKSFVDENDWTYTMDVLADGESQVAVRAQYNGKYQFFVGTGNASTGTVATTEQLLQGGTKQHLRLIYDFKTDRLISGWMPSGTITNDVILNADMLLARVGQGNADQINIATAGIGIQDIKTIYAVLQLDRDTMLNETTGINAEGYLHKNAIYWFSLPFDVKVNDIFGVDGYGTKWVLQYYDGAKRAKIGFFQETETFWTYLGINDTIKANIGYALCLDPDYFDSAEDAIWANNRQSVCFYFPSLDKNLHIVESKDTITTHVPQHECTIDRTFGEKNEKNHKITDTDWNVIGSPAFQNLTGTANMGGFQSLYEWQPSNNTYQVASVNGFTFKSTSAYLVQFHGEIKWQAASVINPTVAAPRYAYADEKNYTVELQFHYGSQWDRTYVALKDNANEDFVLNEDLTKMINAGQPNIYSYAGAYDVAYNGTTLKDQIVNLGVRAPKNGTYTFSMPKDFSGTAQLYDTEEGTITDLNVSNYSVDLNKGTYNNRFQLLLKVEASTPTSIETNGQKGRETDGKTKKLLINGNIYLINDGRVYNATGAELR